MANGKGKGSDFEREISKALSLWWTEGERDDIFWRSTQSGGRATTRGKIGKGTAGSYGDLACIDPSGQPFIDNFVIEIKRGYSDELDLLAIIDGKAKPMLFQFWDQVEKDRVASLRPHSILIFKRDRKQIVLMFDHDLYRRLKTCCNFGTSGIDSMIIKRDDEKYYILQLSDFLERVNPSAIILWK